MLTYIVRRLGYSVVMLALVSFVGFIIIELPPGDFLTQRLSELEARGDRSAEQRIEEYRIRYGLDVPLLPRYLKWARNFVRGDFGESFQFERPVRQLIEQRFWLTVLLAIATILIVWAIAIPVGVYSASNQYSIGDQFFTTFSFIGLGIPGFLLALLILYVVWQTTETEIGGLFSQEYRDAPWNLAKVVDLLKHLWIPAVIGSVTGTAGLIRIMRGNLLDTLGQPFVESARARGLTDRKVTWKHGVRMAVSPLIVILGSEALPMIISGNALVAIVLNLRTIGPLFVTALQKQDMYLAGTTLVFFTVILLVGNLLADLALAWMDPRIRLE